MLAIFRTLGLSTSIALIISAQALAKTGPWPREQDEHFLVPGYSYSQFNQSQPGAGYEFTKQEFSLYYEYGLWERLTLISRMAVQEFSNEPDPDPEFDPPAFSSQAGSKVGARLSVFQTERWAGAVEAFYHFDTPQSTGQDLEAGGGEDFEVRTALGRSFGQRGFGDIQFAWRERGEFDGSEIHFDTTFGVPVLPRTRLMIQTYSVWSDGAPDLFVGDYQGHRTQVSVLYNVRSKWAIQAGLTTTLHADGIAEENAAMISLWRTWQ